MVLSAHNKKQQPNNESPFLEELTTAALSNVNRRSTQVPKDQATWLSRNACFFRLKAIHVKNARNICTIKYKIPRINKLGDY